MSEGNKGEAELIEKVTNILFDKFAIQVDLSEVDQWRPIAKAAIEAIKGWDDWISIKDKLPPLTPPRTSAKKEAIPYLVVYQSNKPRKRPKVMTALFTGNKWKFFSPRYRITGNSECVTHWMALPLPPQNEE